MSVETVLEARAECSDAERAQAVLADALSAARAPKRGGGRWTLSLRVTRAQKSLSAEADIVDDRGALVAQRTLTDKSAKACAPVARAIGAWATLVLDAELGRAKDDADRAEAAAAPPDPPIGAAAAPPPSADVPVDGPVDTKRTLELGVMMYLRNGVATTGGAGGVAPYVSVEVARSWMLRPGLLLGRSTSAVPVDGSGTSMANFAQYGVRVDICRRVPGNYIEHRGIELDLCMGSDASIVVAGGGSAGTADRLAVGPSMILRGELGAGFALELRGLVGLNAIRDGFGTEGDVPAFTAGGELGLSWRLP